MGYTHYWSTDRAMSSEESNRFGEFFVKAAVRFYEKGDVPRIAGYADGGSFIDEDGDVCFNGIGPNGEEDFEFQHETFCFSTRRAQEEFCKTDRKPYDLMVCMALIAAKDIMGDSMTVGTDGDDQDWAPACDMYKELTGRSVIAVVDTDSSVSFAFPDLEDRVEDDKFRNKLHAAIDAAIDSMLAKGDTPDQFMFSIISETDDSIGLNISTCMSSDNMPLVAHRLLGEFLDKSVNVVSTERPDVDFASILRDLAS